VYFQMLVMEAFDEYKFVLPAHVLTMGYSYER